jgi:two-component system, chemotaxis family, protein-glutamate methylesterase/glutaminase
MTSDGPRLDEPIRVAVVDDEADLRLLVRSLLSLDPRIKVVGEAADGTSALTLFDELRPDVLVLDQRMPGATGLEVAAQVLARVPDQLIILLSAFTDRTITDEAESLGVAAVLGKLLVEDLADEILRLSA